MDSFGGIEAFARVVETGSFAGAAARLQTAKSSVSDIVRGLEERLGFRLLERTTRRAARAEARAFQLAPTLRVAVLESFGERYIEPGLARFLARFPSIAINVVSGARHTRLVEDKFDLAIRIAETPEPALVVRRHGIHRFRSPDRDKEPSCVRPSSSTTFTDLRLVSLW